MKTNKEISKKLDKLGGINETLKDLVNVMTKPEKPFQNVSSVIGTLATIIGMIEVMGSFFKWF
jgi:HD-like signal output (HDOD) protein